MSGRTPSWLAAPPLEPQERRERARTLWRVIWGSALIGTVVLGLLALVQPATAMRRAESVLVLLVIAAGTHALNRAGRVAVASWVFVLGILGLLGWRSFTSGGLSTPLTSGLVIVVLLAGLLLGTRAGIAVAVVCILLGWAMLLADRAGVMLRPELAFTPLSLLLFLALWIGLAVVLQDQISRSLSVALRRAEEELARRTEAQRGMEASYEALRASEDKFSRVFRAVPAGLAVSTLADGRYLDVNDEFVRIFGWTRDELVGRASVEVGIWPDAQSRERWAGSIAKVGDARAVMATARTKDGTERVVRTSVHRLEIGGEGVLVTSFVDETERVRAEAAKVLAEREYRELVEGVRDVVFALAPEGVITMLNPAFEQITGFPVAEWIGRPFFELVHPDDVPRAMLEMGAALAGSPSDTPPIRVRKADGAYFFAEVNVAPRFEGERVASVFGIGRDVTERAVLEEARARAVQQREALVVDLGERVKELRLLHQTARLFQTATGDLGAILQEWVNLVPAAWQYPDCCEARVSIGEVVASTPKWRLSPWRQEARFRCDAGEGLLEVVYLEERADAAEGPFLKEERALIQSLAELVESYIELRSHREGLEALVARRTEELSENYKRLEGLEKLRDDLVHMVVHDMRSPLTVLSAHLQLLQMSEGHTLEGEAVEDLKAAAKAAKVVTRMANDLLDVSRMEEGKLPLNKTRHDLTAIAREVCDVLARLQRERCIGVDAAGPVEAICDGPLVRRVIENLVSNAIKHTPEEGRIRVTVAGGGRVRVEVHDEGPGVPVDARAKIFEKFGTVTARQNRTYHSAGLGLAFCKLAVEAHGGAIGVESRDPVGSIFWFEIPA